MRRHEYTFVNQNRRCRLLELDGHPIKKIEIQKITTIGGKDYPTAVIRWAGLHQVEIGPRLDQPSDASTGAKIKLSDLSEISDAGPKLGTSFVTLSRPESPPCKEDREENRKILDQVIRQITPGLCLAESR